MSYLQYDAETLFIGEPTIWNLWAMKSILRSFELAYGFKVNFSKVDDNFVATAEGFLHCKVGSLVFMDLGLPIGGNP